MPERVIMLVDLDYFFAQVEEVENPSLKGKPVIVCVYSGRSEDSGAVSTANYIARNYGVRSGMPIALAKRKLQDVEAAFLPVNHLLYDRVSSKVMTILRGFADTFEQVGVDEAYLDVTKRAERDFEQARKLAHCIKEEVKKQQSLSCSIGIGPNKLVAKIASDLQKPDGLTLIKPEQVESVLSPLPVGSLIGVGAKTREKMQALDINTIGDLARYDTQKLVEIFGKNIGSYFHEAALGIDDEPVQERGDTESISRISTLKQDTKDLNAVVEKTNQLCDEVHGDVLNRGVNFGTVGIHAVMADMSVHSRSKTLGSPTNELTVLKRTVRELFERFLNESPLPARRVGVKVSGFTGPERSQKQITSFIEPAKRTA